MLKCRKCGCSDFGVEARQITSMAYRLNSEGQTPLTEQPEVKNELEYKYCFGCNTPITKDDLKETETCTVCGKEVEETVDGKCHDCDAKAKALSKMTKEELITMMLQGKINAEDLSALVSQEPKKEEVKVEEPKVEETKAEEPKVEVKEEEVQTTEEVVAIEETKNALEKAMPNIAPNQNVILEEEVAEDANDYLFESPDVDMTELNIDKSSYTEEIDILAEIDRAVDLSSLKLHNEDINQQL